MKNKEFENLRKEFEKKVLNTLHSISLRMKEVKNIFTVMRRQIWRFIGIWLRKIACYKRKIAIILD